MKEYIKFFLITLLLVGVFSYLFVSLVNLSFDFSIVSKGGRVLFAIFVSAVSFIATVIRWSSDNGGW